MAGASAETAKATYNDLYRVLGDSGQATEAAQHLAMLTSSEQDLAEWTNICQGVYATFGASLPIESLTEAANETAKTGQLTGALADALNWAGVSEEDFQAKLDACNTEAEREALIRETLNGLYSDAAAKYEENNKGVLEQNEAQAQLMDTMAQLGEVVAPIITAFTQFANDALALVIPYIQQLAEQYLPLLQEALGTASGYISTIFTYITENAETLGLLAGIIGGIAAAVGLYNAVAAIKAAMAAAEVTTVWGLVAAYAAQAAAMIVAIAPYALIVAAIAAVIAIIVLCVQHWDEIKAKVAEVWGNIKESVSEAAGKVKEGISNMVENAKQKWDNMKSAASEKFSAIKSAMTEKITAAKSAISTAFDAIKSNIQSKIEAAKAVISSVFSAIKSVITGDIDGAKTAVSNAIEAIKGFFNFSWSLPKLKMPSISITGKFSLDPLQVPKFSISWNALGGVFDTPTLFGFGGSLQGLGEDGAEAVVPLEKNLGWLDKLAGMLNERMGSRPIYLMVDKKVLGQVATTSINDITAATGRCPIKVM